MPKLDGKIALILGGAGLVGEGIVRSFLDEGAFVIVPSRSPERLATLRKLIGSSQRLVTVPANISTQQGAEELRTQILARLSRIDAVIASLGGFKTGPHAIELSIDEFRRVLDDNLISHFIAARAFLPALRRCGTYTFVAGLAGEVPQAGTAAVSVAMAGQQALQRVLAEEQGASGVRINEILVKSVLSKSRGAVPAADQLTAEEVGLFAAKLASDEGAQWNGVQIRLLDRASYEAAMR